MENNEQSPARPVPWFRSISMVQPGQAVSNLQNPEQTPEHHPVMSRIQTFRSLNNPPHPSSPPPVIKKRLDDGENSDATKMVKFDLAPTSPIIKRIATLREAAASRASPQPEEIPQVPMLVVPANVVPAVKVSRPRTDVVIPEKAKIVETAASTPPRSPATKRLQPPPPLPVPRRKQSLPTSPTQSPSSVLRRKVSSPPSPSPPPSPQARGEFSALPSQPALEIKNSKKQNNGNMEKPRSPPLSPPTNPKDPITAQVRKKKLSIGDNKGRMGMITMAGENTGAYMNLIGGSKENGKKQDHFNGKSHRIGPSENLETKNQSVETKATLPAATAVMNNNVQGVNNSIIFHGTCRHGSPGVHIKFSSSKNPRLKKWKIAADESPTSTSDA
ncbi:hypothetical protein ZOSMA_177G00050 [Zostera marina]|uniref:Uncharacterized protein n=1 Tax=Zostera marina TaxID=29655 RepID=A0A0K9PTX1_ZOSMR|nr:hypothetical protein ZOSMA_177G00050 [Zostera marina]